MSFSTDDSLVLAAILVAVALLLIVAHLVRVPYPILLVVGGLGLSFVPGIPEIQLPPDLVLIAVLPPLLYGAAFFTSLRDLRENAGAISLLAVGLVLTTMLVVAAVAHFLIADLSWHGAFVLGAVVSPTDPTAVSAIAERLGLPRRIVALIEGESLVNDGTALVAYKFAVVAVVTGSFSLADAAGSFLLNVVGGIAIGLGVGFLIRQVRRRLDDPPLEITISLLSGFFAYLPAQAAGVSGVLAAVTVGIYMGWHTPELTSAQTRLQGIAVWEILFFLLNALLFALIGLQLPGILDALSGRSTATLVGYAAAVTAAVIAARFLWVVPGTFLTARFRRRRRPFQEPGKAAVLIGWSGMRGAVSLAAALALPLTTDAGQPFPNRPLIIFLTFGVILGTLVLQGLTLPAVVKMLGLEDEGRAEKEETKARLYAAEAALARLEELAEEEWVREDTLERLRGMFGFRRERFRSRFDPESDGAVEDRSAAFQRLMRELLDAERDAVFELRRTRRIDDDVMRRVVRDLDLEEARLDA
ncbi:MAG TPA: Na+/H+ antiporter [Gaiellaceae bacterium]|jgi:CPA1 family monovalent cation:H+ antiporter|nr:Na+/H+ antiporter [Gaiellaceae bacterium]